MAAPPRILLIDDDDASRALLRLLIDARWPEAQLTEVHDALSLARAMRSPVQDLCIVDPERSWADSSELLSLLCEDEAVGPVVVYSPSDRAAPAIAALHTGAASYVVKDAQGPLKLIDELTRWLGPGQTSRADARKHAQTRHAVAMIAHDLQEPIRSVQNYLEVLSLEHGQELSTSAQQLIGQASDSAQRAIGALLQSIEDLQPASRMPSFAEPELPILELDEDDESVESTTAWSKDVVRFPEVVTNANLVLEETLEILASTIEREGATIQRDSLAPVAVQSSHLRRILQNLVGNALKFRSEAEPIIQIGCSEDEERVCFTVTDNGIGIEPEDQSRIFQMFTRVHDGQAFPGTGIGLAAAKNLVESYGGEIQVESTPGSGSCFRFSLPSVPGARARASRKR